MEITALETARRNALAEHLGINPEDIDVSDCDECQLAYGSEEYFVCTDHEANERAAEEIHGTVWAFRPEFLSSYTGLPSEVFVTLSKLNETAQETVIALIERCEGGITTFVDTCINADGRGHFLAIYDDEEAAVGDFYIYRIN